MTTVPFLLADLRVIALTGSAAAVDVGSVLSCQTGRAWLLAVSAVSAGPRLGAMWADVGSLMPAAVPVLLEADDFGWGVHCGSAARSALHLHHGGHGPAAGAVAGSSSVAPTWNDPFMVLGLLAGSGI